ncbi:hypothetical protein N7457_002869 [Penicillium paradoxum]|uniref:uncharacterized protein n=1 Tax=Penicillium paradoxum TaxID=176176 RepID=UPI0025499AFD|nr:uncharacterized protein N7457_002869 [Penicillium paradoxum]KAJ5787879.1 hypothetical protein N7457_002869 [Penicillium paradoxum]
MHSTTAGCFRPVLNSVSWISVAVKCRLLERKGRADLMLYCSGWKDIFKRACDHEDDRHLAKIIRAVATAAELTKLESAMICERYEYPRIMSIEIQRVTARWPRHVGFDEAWFHVPDRKSQSSRSCEAT